METLRFFFILFLSEDSSSPRWSCGVQEGGLKAGEGKGKIGMSNYGEDELGCWRMLADAGGFFGRAEPPSLLPLRFLIDLMNQFGSSLPD